MLTVPQKSDRVSLRRLSARDIDAFCAYRSDPDVARFQGWEPMDHAASLGFLNAMHEVALLRLGKWTQLGIAERGRDTLIGDVGICMSEDGSEAELGITLSKPAQGQGLGQEAVELVCSWLWQIPALTRIEAITHAENSAALALLARTPFAFVKDTNEIMNGAPVPERWFEWRRS